MHARNRLSLTALGLIAAATALLPTELAAAVDRWSFVAAAPGGRVLSLAVAPAQPQVLYAATGGALFKSGDGGGSWVPVYLQDAVTEVAVHPGDAGTAYAVTGRDGHFEVTADGGATWQEPDPAWRAPGRLVTTPAEPAAVYAQYTVGLAKTVDGGRTWQELAGAPGLEAFALALDLEADPRRAGGLYLLGATAAGAPRGWLSADGGSSWEALPLPPGAAVDLAVDPSQPQRLLAVNQTGSVWVTDDRGRTWRRPGRTPLPAGLVRVWVGGGAAPPILVSTGSRLFVSRDGGRDYDEVQLSAAEVLQAAAFDPNLAEAFYLGLDRGGVRVTRDGGRSFEPNALAAGELSAPAAHPGQPGALFAVAAGDLVRSFDGGRSWERAPLDPPGGGVLSGIPTLGYGPEPPLFVPLSSGLALSRDRGTTWSFVCPQCQWAGRVLTTPADPDLAVAIGSFTGDGSYRSLDGGLSWAREDFAPLALDPGDPQTLYRRLDAFVGERLEKSTDGGAHWAAADSGLHPGFFVLAFAAHPSGSGRLWVGTDEGLYRSDDGAASWQRVWFESAAHDVEWLGLDPSDPDTAVAVARESGAPPDADGTRMLVTRDGGASWETGGIPGLPTGAGALPGDPLHPGTFYLASRAGHLYALTLRTPSACAGDATTLCLDQGRFRVRASWRDFQGGGGAGQAVDLTPDTGAFWFFDADNLELAVKVLDGTVVNGRRWVFYGALSTVEYVLDVVDTATGEPRTYFNPSGALASRGDTAAFPGAEGDGSEAGVVDAAQADHLAPAAAGACAPGPTVLCLGGGRFRVEVEWEDFQGGSGAGQAVDLTADSGAFWFFHPDNLELAVKVLDGREVNGRFWVFYGALSNVGYTVTVTDTESGEERVYENASGRFRSRADTAAF